MRALVLFHFLLTSFIAAYSDEIVKIPETKENSSPSKIENFLGELPSKFGSHIEKIKAMADNTWLNIGQATADPKWGNEGVARGRAWCSKMAYAADLGGAFFCGTGSHGAVKSDGRYMDDLWFYDANAHKWICLYAGADKNMKLHLDKDGFEVNEKEEHIPVSYLSHAYNNTTYNSDLRKYQIIWVQCPWWTKALPQRWDWLEVPEDKRTYGNVGTIISSPKHPLIWDVASNKWERKFVAGDGPKGHFQSIAEYIPSLKKTLYLHNGVFWAYDFSNNTWTAGAKAPASTKGGFDSNACYDSKNERIYLAGAKSFACFDIKANTWKELEAKNQPDSLLNTNTSQMFFDSVNGVVLWHKTNGSIAIYDPESNTWTDLGDTSPKIPYKKFSSAYMLAHGFYNAELNAHFFYMAGDSGLTDATMLVYRFKNPKKEVEKK